MGAPHKLAAILPAGITRREFMALIGGTAAWPVAAPAQHRDSMRRVGVLMLAESDPESHAEFAAFLQGLKELGWSEARNLRIETRWSGGDANRIRQPVAMGWEGGRDRDRPSDEESRTGYGVLTTGRDPSKLTVAS